MYSYPWSFPVLRGYFRPALLLDKIKIIHHPSLEKLTIASHKNVKIKIEDSSKIVGWEKRNQIIFKDEYKLCPWICIHPCNNELP